jgi:hypothetical protein
VLYAHSFAVGSAIYVYGILSHSKSDPISNAELYFFIDGTQVGTFSFTPNGSRTYSYNYLLYSNNNIPYAPHSFRLQNGRIGGPVSLVLLDYLVYST